ncbi:S8 family peptidase [Bacillaceae bacterium SIJ1]|uniref:S8 family peptidase n=1 Tax=Litoribacterium kuwaitense TaxID=1398745 RepID=UPI0013EC5840|nr:S8 family peptidase [Litoribacterium kuwaitense]NGP46271.1 S8 family peptidase [Litoribacterium kuwaitense]
MPYDDNGHGTHCAGCIAADGRCSAGRYQGIAPNANLVVVKVLNRYGHGALSDVISGIDWCIEHKDIYRIRILSMSIGSQALEPPDEDPVVQAVERAWAAGIFVVTAAGNEGPGLGTVATPGISSTVVTVGAGEGRLKEGVAAFSSRGPTIHGALKPDVIAPGVNIISLRAPRSFQDKFGQRDRRDGAYFNATGTSMATPIVAGIAAQLLEKAPALTPDELKTLLCQSCETMELPSSTEGHGLINAEQALATLSKK